MDCVLTPARVSMAAGFHARTRNLAHVKLRGLKHSVNGEHMTTYRVQERASSKSDGGESRTSTGNRAT